jgi:hypothetical protein
MRAFQAADLAAMKALHAKALHATQLHAAFLHATYLQMGLIGRLLGNR